MIEEDVAGLVAQDLMERGPRRSLFERRVEELLDPCRVKVLRPARPLLAHGPDALCRRARPWRLLALNGDVTRKRAALRSRTLARELGLPPPRGRRGDLGEPEIGRSAVPIARFGRDGPIGSDERELAVERLLDGEDDAQGGAVPWCDRRGEEGELGRLLAGGMALGLGARARGGKCVPDQQKCCRSGNKLACIEQSSSPGFLDRGYSNNAKALAETWQHF